MKRFFVLFVCVLAACATDEPQNGANNSNNKTNNSTGNASNNLMNNQTNNSSTNNATNNPTNNALNNATNNATTNNVADMGMDVGQDMEVDAMADLGPGSDGDLCATAIPISAGQTIDNQTTVGATDDYEARARDEGCPNNVASGRDRVYLFNSPVAGNFRVTVVPEASFDPAIYVRLDCASLVCVTGTVLNGEGVQESVTFDAIADTDYYLIVDGELGDSGAYSIMLQGA